MNNKKINNETVLDKLYSSLIKRIELEGYYQEAYKLQELIKNNFNEIEKK